MFHREICWWSSSFVNDYLTTAQHVGATVKLVNRASVAQMLLSGCWWFAWNCQRRQLASLQSWRWKYRPVEWTLMILQAVTHVSTRHFVYKYRKRLVSRAAKCKMSIKRDSCRKWSRRFKGSKMLQSNRNAEAVNIVSTLVFGLGFF